jgi:hypothetical protein
MVYGIMAKHVGLKCIQLASLCRNVGTAGLCGSKVAALLCSGGYPASLSKFVGARISPIEELRLVSGDEVPTALNELAEEQMAELEIYRVQAATEEIKKQCKVNFSEFESTNISLWTNTDSIMHAMVARYQAASGTTVASKMASQNTHLDDARNSEWRGALGTIEFGAREFDFAPLSPVHDSHEYGASATLNTMKNNYLKWGPAQHHCPGMGQLLQAIEGNFYVTLFPVQEILDAGIVLSNLLTYFATSGGQEFLTKYGLVVLLMQGDIMYVPWGWMSIPLHYSTDPTHQERAHLWALAHLNPEAANKISFAAFTAIMNSTCVHARSQPKPMWQKLAEVLEAFKAFGPKEVPTK